MRTHILSKVRISNNKVNEHIGDVDTARVIIQYEKPYDELWQIPDDCIINFMIVYYSSFMSEDNVWVMSDILMKDVRNYFLIPATKEEAELLEVLYEDE